MIPLYLVLTLQRQMEGGGYRIAPETLTLEMLPNSEQLGACMIGHSWGVFD